MKVSKTVKLWALFLWIKGDLPKSQGKDNLFKGYTLNKIVRKNPKTFFCALLYFYFILLCPKVLAHDSWGNRVVDTWTWKDPMVIGGIHVEIGFSGSFEPFKMDFVHFRMGWLGGRHEPVRLWKNNEEIYKIWPEILVLAANTCHISRGRIYIY